MRIVTGPSLGVRLKACEGRKDFCGTKRANIDSCFNKVGRKNETAGGHEFNPVEKQFSRRRRPHPKLWARFQSLLERALNAEGPWKTADEAEELLLQELRPLGSTSMNVGATQAEERGGDELKGPEATVGSRKKKR